MKKVLLAVATATALLLPGCDDANVASRNLSQAADQFEIDRRIVFYNGITDTYMMVVEGLCSIHVDKRDMQLEVVCKTGYNEYKKHYLYLSDNVSYIVEQLKSRGVSVYHYRMIFKPQLILPDIDFKGDVGELLSEGE